MPKKGETQEPQTLKGREKLLKSIETFRTGKLKHVETVDKSAPRIPRSEKIEKKVTSTKQLAISKTDTPNQPAPIKSKFTPSAGETDLQGQLAAAVVASAARRGAKQQEVTSSGQRSASTEKKPTPPAVAPTPGARSDARKGSAAAVPATKPSPTAAPLPVPSARRRQGAPPPTPGARKGLAAAAIKPKPPAAPTSGARKGPASAAIKPTPSAAPAAGGAKKAPAATAPKPVVVAAPHPVVSPPATTGKPRATALLFKPAATPHRTKAPTPEEEHAQSMETIFNTIMDYSSDPSKIDPKFVNSLELLRAAGLLTFQDFQIISTRVLTIAEKLPDELKPIIYQLAVLSQPPPPPSSKKEQAPPKEEESRSPQLEPDTHHTELGI